LFLKTLTPQKYLLDRDTYKLGLIINALNSKTRAKYSENPTLSGFGKY
jgi:hypothetical protein